MPQSNPTNPLTVPATVTVHDAPGFPLEPFACPHCGQMLAATVRVCVACKEPVDPVLIKPVLVELPQPRARLVPSGARVHFPWTLFFALFAVRIVVLGSIAVLQHGDFSKAALLEEVIDLVTAGLVFRDASRKHIRKPIRWALGSLFLWIVFLPWYLARRRELQKACLLVEADSSPLMRGLMFLLFLALIIGLLTVLFPGPK
jgi:hypothetical protein